MTKRTVRTLVLATAISVPVSFTAGMLWAHDFWIIPDAFQVAGGTTIEIRGQTSSRFPVSQSAVTAERVAEARLIGESSDERLTDLSISGKSLLIRHRPTTPGQRIVAVALVPRTTTTTPERLKRYIALEGAPELAQRYEREGAYPKADSVIQISAKFAKTFVEIGRNGPRAFGKAVGHPLEIVPVSDPSTLHPGDTLRVRLLYNGRPVADARLHSGTAPADLTATSDSAAQAAAPVAADLVVVTGPDGVAEIPIGKAGLWNVRTLYGAPAATSGAGLAAWEVYFVTAVFSVAAHH